MNKREMQCRTRTYLVYGVTLQIFLYIVETVAKLVPDGAGSTDDPVAFCPPATVEAVLFLDPAGAGARAFLEAGAGPDCLDIARCV